MFPNVRSAETVESIPSVPGDLPGELLLLARRKGGTKLERRMTELERAKISERIKEARVQAGMTQEELADLLHVRARTIANYEAGRVPWRLLGQIGELTGVSQQWLIHGVSSLEASGDGSDLLLRQVVDRLEALETTVDQATQQVAEALARMASAIEAQSAGKPVEEQQGRRAARNK